MGRDAEKEWRNTHTTREECIRLHHKVNERSIVPELEKHLHYLQFLDKRVRWLSLPWYERAWVRLSECWEDVTGESEDEQGEGDE